MLVKSTSHEGTAATLRLAAGVPLKHEDVEAAVIEGAVQRLRPKLMTSTTRRTEASASAAKIKPARQALLGRRSSILVRMAAVSHCGHARNGGALAQGRIPFVLEADLQGQEAGRETTDVKGDSGIDLPNGR